MEEGIGLEWLGETTSWSGNVLVPYLNQRAGEAKVQKMMRGFWWVDFDGEKKTFLEDPLRLIDAFAFGHSAAVEKDQEDSKKLAAQKKEAESDESLKQGPLKKRRIDDDMLDLE